jgi:hypothetical protein
MLSSLHGSAKGTETPAAAAAAAAQVIEEDTKIADIHANSESFDSKAELSFKYLQVRKGFRVQI